MARAAYLPIPEPPDRANLSRKEAIANYKSFLKVQEQRIRIRHKGGMGGPEVAGARARLLDVVLRKLFEEAAAPAEGAGAANPASVALVAVGGYGRALLNPHSDIDLHFVFGGGKPGPELEELVNDILYMLWDVGMKVGHAVRSIPQALKQAGGDYQTMSSLIESRLIAGEPAVYEELMTRFRKQCVEGREDKYLANRFDDLEERHQKALGTVYVQEPNVKSGMGGLRDVHTVIWMTWVRYGTTDLEVLVREGLVSPVTLKELTKGYHFLLRVRNDLHYEENRARDVLTLYLQGVVATNFRYPQRSILRRCEAFMRDYYQATRGILQASSQVMEGFHLDRIVRTRQPLLPFLPAKRVKREEFDGFYSEEGRCFALRPGVFEEDPHRLMRLFQHTQLRHLRLAPELKELVIESFRLVNKTFRYNKANRGTFEAILSRKGEVGRTLRQMHRVGLLGRYLPEFGALDCLVQHEFFHRYTADEHTLRTIDALDSLTEGDGNNQGRLPELLRDLEDPATLYLALIMHDTGRAENARHHEDASALLASRLCSRMQIRGPRRRLLLFLVDHHLSFWKTATTKNLEDPATIEEFARIVRNQETLDALYLLTYADANGTSSESWNSWKASLMDQLYRHTSAFLRDRESYEKSLAVDREELGGETARLLPAGYQRESKVHFQLMPERYLRTRTPEQVADDLRLFRSFFEHLREPGTAALIPAVSWQAYEEQGCSLLSVVSWNRPLLLARLTACLSAQNLNILAADIFTRGDDLALDVFRVCTPDWQPVTEERTLSRFSESLEKGFITSEPDLDALVAKGESKRKSPDERLPGFPMRIFISNDVTPAATFVEIQALDRIGLLFEVFRTVGRFGLEVTSARVNTTKGAAIDTFTLTTAEGNQLTDEDKLHDLQQALADAVGVPLDRDAVDQVRV